jgi:cytochrome P450
MAGSAIGNFKPSVSELTPVLKYHDVAAVFNSGARQALHQDSDASAAWGPSPNDPFFLDSLITLHGDDHAKRRRLETKLFSRPARARLEYEIVLPALRRQLAHSLAGAVNGEADLTTFTRLVLARLTCAVLGTELMDDLETADRLRLLSEDIGGAAGAHLSTGDRKALMERGLAARKDFVCEFYEAARARADSVAAEQADDLISLLVSTPDSIPSEDVLLHEALLYLIASSSTTTSAIPHAVYELEHRFESHPDERDLLASFEFCRSVASETLRLYPPIPRMWRQMMEDITLPSGLQLHRGEFVNIDLLASARDEEVFGADADIFNPFRQIAKGVLPQAFTFGGGPHICIGRALSVGDVWSAQDESAPQGILTQLLHEFYSWGLTTDADRPPVRREATEKNQYASFPVRFLNPRL